MFEAGNAVHAMKPQIMVEGGAGDDTGHGWGHGTEHTGWGV